MPNPDPLDPLIQRWENVPAPTPSVKSEVWRRIAMAESAPVQLGWVRRIERWFTIPAFSGAFVACCVLLGLFLAEVRVSRVQRERQVELARQYIRLIDPLLVDSSSAEVKP